MKIGRRMDKSLKLLTQEKIQMSDVVRWLVSANYVSVEKIDYFGQYRLLGDIIWIFPVNLPYPIQISFFGNEIDSMIKYDTLPDQNDKIELKNIQINPNIIDSDNLRFEPGQYVVHSDHGIGRFKTMGQRRVDQFIENNLSGVIEYQPFLIIEYADGGELFVPPEQTEKLTHYIGSRNPVLNKLGSQKWHTTKKKVEESLFKLSRQLLEVAAKRQIKVRQPLSIQPEWLQLMSNQFPYDETDDQFKAIDAVVKDLSSNKLMDRLICGDAGFGKTEVAVRAAGAMVSAGFQVAILAPTTILARQHYATFSNRLASLPVKVAELSRFVSKENQAKIISQLAANQIDIIIGTHRLLSSDVNFNNLGLLIIDEEQKFGVKHKEQIKQKRTEIDVLTLSATPIPRTLFSALSGLREISLISSPPNKRLPIKTTIQKTDEALILSAIKTEKSRSGQVFILHNDVSTIQNRTITLQKQLPDLVIKFAHGQMPEQKLALVMAEMIEGKIDVLVTSTIIESGLDMPNVNTLIVEKCDHFGLSDLYQIRGRVGRSDVQAYAYMFYDQTELTYASQQRFKALLEFDQLGSGVNIALKDLEIRGGGNVLGKEQHGNMESVGLSLYTKMLQLVVEKLKK